MTEFKHTPGPWAYEVDDCGDNVSITSDEGAVLWGCGCCGSPSVGRKSDVPLIAAAPELLEALRSIVEEGLSTSKISAAKAAIAKATGVQP